MSSIGQNDLTAALELVPKYNGQFPRYTSYPTAQELKDIDSTAPVVSRLRKLSGDKHLSLYVHLPYCPSLCYFCACNKIIDANPKKYFDYLELLKKEVQNIAQHSGRKFDLAHIHLGGGSPSYMPQGGFKELDAIITAGFNVSPSTTKSIEIDPRSFSKEKAQEIAALGYARASLGVQDFDDNVQQSVNRIQPYSLTKDTIDTLREAGFQGVNIDLIYGLPGQTIQTLTETVNKTLTLRPDRIAFYGYAHVTWKVKVQKVFGKLPLPSPEERLELFRIGAELLIAGGYEYIGLDHFALPSDSLNKASQSGTLRRNFMGYTDEACDGIIGLGLSSISDLDGMLYQNHTDMDRYSASVNSGDMPVVKYFSRSEQDLARAEIIETIMCHGAIKTKSEGPHSILASSLIDAAKDKLAKFEQDKLIEFIPGGFKVLGRGRFFLRQIAAVFDEYLPEHIQTSGNKMFSQGV